jgi:hypothetical protein
MAADVENRRLISRLGGLARASAYDGLTVTETARRVFRDSFTDKARAAALAAGLSLSEAEILRRGEALRKLHYTRLALRSVQARKRKEPA